MTPTDADDPLRTTDHSPNAAGQCNEVTTDSPRASGLESTRACLPQRQEPPVQELTDRLTASAPAIPGYHIEGILGRGGMGVVYKARHLALKRVVALKMILSGGHAGDGERHASGPRPRRWRGLQHPNIVQVYEVGEHEGLPYAALEFVEGGTFAQRLKRNPVPREAAEVIATLARAMHLAHSRNIVHRDLKPANILSGCRRHPQGDGLRPGPATGQRQRPNADRSGDRHAQLHGAGAGRRRIQARRAGGGRLRPGGHPVRVPDGAAAVPGHQHG